MSPLYARVRHDPAVRLTQVATCYFLVICPCASSLLVFLCTAVCYFPAVRHMRRDLPFSRCTPSRVVPAIIPAVRHVRRGCHHSFLCAYVRHNDHHPCGMPRASRFAATLAACQLRRNAFAPVVHSHFSWAVFCIKVDLGSSS